jgi:hypothetical protein
VFCRIQDSLSKCPNISPLQVPRATTLLQPYTCESVQYLILRSAFYILIVCAVFLVAGVLLLLYHSPVIYDRQSFRYIYQLRFFFFYHCTVRDPAPLLYIRLYKIDSRVNKLRLRYIAIYYIYRFDITALYDHKACFPSCKVIFHCSSSYQTVLSVFSSPFLCFTA